VPVVCRKLSFVGKEDDLVLARKQGQIVARGDRRWLVRVYLGRDRQTRRRLFHNRTIRGPLRAAQRYLNARLREREEGRNLEGAEISLNEYLDRWLEIAARPKLRAKSFVDYESLLRRYIRPALGDRMLRGLSPLVEG
jgi:integrase